LLPIYCEEADKCTPNYFSYTQLYIVKKLTNVL